MTSVVSICNRALSKIGDEIQITSLNDNTKPARYCKILYPDARDFVLRSFPWRFALKRYLLAPLSQSPLFGYTHQYVMPSECLRIWKVADDVDYQVEGKHILTNTGSLAFIGIRRIENPDDFDAMFVETLALKIAVELAVPLTASISLKNDLANEYKNFVQQAKTVSSMEGKAPVFSAFGWLESRY